jgi:hypothetical protein
MTTAEYHCEDCDEPIIMWSEFVAHAKDGHSVMTGPPSVPAPAPEGTTS